MPKILLILLLIVGIGTGVYLVRNQQTNTETKAADTIVSSFEFRDANGNLILCDENTADGVPVCITPTLDISVTLKSDPLPQ